MIKKKANIKTFLLHHSLGCLKELCDDYGNEPIFTHVVNLKRELLTKLYSCIFETATLYSHGFIVEDCNIKHFAEGKKSNLFSNI